MPAPIDPNEGYELHSIPRVDIAARILAQADGWQSTGFVYQGTWEVEVYRRRLSFTERAARRVEALLQSVGPSRHAVQRAADEVRALESRPPRPTFYDLPREQQAGYIRRFVSDHAEGLPRER